MRIRDIENYSEKILKDYDIEALPVNPQEIAEYHGIIVQEADLGEGVSGAIVVKKGKAKIGYNPAEVEHRQRFTIAHELGHYLLHRDKMEMFIDKTFYALRDENSSKGEYKMEREANAFAAALLMPRSLVIREAKKLDFDLLDDKKLRKLADKFDVSTQAMSFRLANLNIL